MLIMEKEEQGRYIVSDLDKIWLEYDKQNDILYINFGYDIEDADEEVMTGEDIVVRIKEGRVVGIMVMNFSEKVNIMIY